MVNYKVLLLGAVLVSSLQQAIQRSTQPDPISRELADVTLQELSAMSSRNLMLYGVELGMPVDTAEKMVRRQGITVKRLSPNSLSFFGSSGESSTGVDAFVEDGRIAWMRVGPKTHFFDDDHPQTL